MLLVALLGCPHHAAAPAVPDALHTLAKPPTKLQYDECSVVFEGMEPLCVPVTEEWTGPVTEGDDLVWDVTVREGKGDDARQREFQRIYYGPSGMGWLGTAVRSRPYEAFEPVEQVLPADPQVGASWQATVTVKGEARQRACEVHGAPSCPGGVVSHCDTTFPDRHVILDLHFCPGVGFVGYEGRVEKPGAPTLRMWSKGLLRDGQPVAPFR